MADAGRGGSGGAPVAHVCHTDIERKVVVGDRRWRLDEIDLAEMDREPATMVEAIRQSLAAGV